MQWIKDNIWEINQSKGLRYLGLFLSLIHIITFFQWNAIYNRANGADVVCWSFFEKCKEAAFVTGNGGALYTYLALAIISSILFLLGPALTSKAWGVLAALFVFKLSIYLFDYRLYSNTHTLLFFVESVLLLVPNKRTLFRSLIVVFYLASGLFKLNTEWLTGYAFEPLEFSPKLNEWLAALSLIAELTLPFLLLAKSNKKITLGIASLTIYHLLMGPIAGYYHVLIVLLLLSLYPVFNMEDYNEEQGYAFNSYLRPSPSKLWAPFGLAVFIAIQALPFFIKLEWPTTPFEIIRPSLPQECYQKSYALYEGSVKILPDSLFTFDSRNRCKTYVRKNALKEVCRKLEKEPGFITVFSSFSRRAFTESHYKTVFEVSDACGKSQR